MKEELIDLGILKSNFKISFRNRDEINLRSGSGNIATIKIPFEVTPELASLFGHSLGDGHIKKNKSQF